MSRILIVFKDSFPLGMASTSRVHEYCRSLHSIGMYVSVYAQDINDEVDLDYVDQIGELTSGNEKIVLDQVSDVIVKNEINIVIFYGLSSRNQARLMRRFKKVKFIRELNEMPFSFKASRKDYIPFRNFFRRLFWELSCLKSYDGIICISRSLQEYVRERTKSSVVSMVIPALSTRTDCYLESESSKEIKCYAPYVFHAGYINEQKDGISYVLEAFRIVAQSNNEIKFFFTVKKAEKKTIDLVNSYLASSELKKRIQFLGFLSRDEVDQYMANSSLAVLCKPDNLQNRYNFPTKMAEYASMGVPIVYAGKGEALNYFENNRTFLNCRVDSKEISKSILLILSDHSLRNRLSTSGKALAKESFTYHSVSEQIEIFINSLE